MQLQKKGGLDATDFKKKEVTVTINPDWTRDQLRAHGLGIGPRKSNNNYLKKTVQSTYRQTD